MPGMQIYSIKRVKRCDKGKKRRNEESLFDLVYSLYVLMQEGHQHHDLCRYKKSGRERERED